MKIRTKFSIASGIVVFIIISFLAFSTYFLVKETLKEKNNAYIKDNATLLSSSISNWLVGKKSQIGVIKEELEKNFTIENFQYQLENKSLRTDFSLIFGTIATERGLRSNNPNRVNPSDIDFRERDWYKLGATTSGVSYTAPYVDAATKELLLSVVAPINVGGQLRGVIGGDLSLSEIAKSVNTINFNGTGEAFIVDAGGNIITHQDTNLNGKSATEVYRESPTQVNQLIDIEHNGSDKILYFTQLDETSGLDWYVGVILDKDLVYQSLSTFTKTTIVFTFFSIALCVFTLRKLAKHLLSPLAALEDAITEVASGGGDLTQRLGVDGEDECTVVASRFNEFLTSLQQLVKEITAKASNVLVSSGEVNTLSKGSSEQLSQQFSQIDGLATAMNEMSTTSADIAASAQEAASLVTSVNDTADASRDLFDKTAKDVVLLCESISLSLDLSNQLAEYSNNIEKILSVINGIAEQTNLLALNAAIEAARAGEQGRGFAVVADEVRSLASRTQESTTEIKSMIDHIQNYSSRVQSSMNESQSNAEECVKHTEVANQSLESINNSVKEIMDRNIQIATAIEEQSVVIEEVNRTTINIRDISVQVDEFAGKQHECSNELVSDVEIQQKLLDKFIV